MLVGEAVALSPVLYVAAVALIGLLVGSFLNVVIHRLPVMMEREWQDQAREILNIKVDKSPEVFNLARPCSRCPGCGHQIRPWENMPILSWLMLRGRCSSCRVPISIRYPLIELSSALLSGLVAFKFGYGVQCLSVLLLVWLSIAVAMIDLDHQLLPDAIVQPAIWLGLGMGYLGVFTSLGSSLIGAVAGYLSFAVPAWVFAKVTGRVGMGDGDFKLMALFGAWLGWQMLPIIFLFASIAAVIVGVALRRLRNEPYPFGPFIVVAGLVALFFGHDLYAWYAHENGIHIGAAFFE